MMNISKVEINAWLKSKSCIYVIFTLLFCFLISFFIPLLLEEINESINFEYDYYLFAINFLFAGYFLVFARNSVIDDEKAEDDPI